MIGRKRPWRQRLAAATATAAALWPGATSAQRVAGIYTDAGYDNAAGTEAICWVAGRAAVNHSNHNHDEILVGQADLWNSTINTGFNWRSPLEPDFVALPTHMLSVCPGASLLHMELSDAANTADQDIRLGRHRFRVGRKYTYHIDAVVDGSAWSRLLSGNAHDLTFTSAEDEDEHQGEDGGGVGPVIHSIEVQFRVVFCPVNGNLCSPFVLASDHHLQELEGHVHQDGVEHDPAETGGADHGRRQTRRMPLRRRRRLEDNHTADIGEDGEGQQNDDKGAIDESLHELFSPYFFLPIGASGNTTVYHFHIYIDVSIPKPGEYLPLGTMQFFLGRPTNSTLTKPWAEYKVDMANFRDTERTVEFFAPIEILTVTKGMQILTYTLVGITSLVQLALFCAALWHRNEGVMKLSQGGFLLVLQAAGIVATASSVLYNPVSNLTCALQGWLTMVPLQLMLAIVFGRLRRIISIMAPLFEWGSGSGSMTRGHIRSWQRTFMSDRRKATSTSGKASSQGNDSVDRRSSQERIETRPSTSSRSGSHRSSRPSLLRSFAPGRRRSLTTSKIRALRQSFTAARLWIVIVLLTMPAVIVELVGLFVFTPTRILVLNGDESVGRYECGDVDDQVYSFASTAVIFVTMLLVLCEAHRSRNLPALFNEASSVSSALVVSLFIAVLGFALIIMMESPTTSPDVPFLMKVIIISSIATSLSWKLVLPKLRLIWRGEKVVISRIITEHRKTQSGNSQLESTFDRDPLTASVAAVTSSAAQPSVASSCAPAESLVSFNPAESQVTNESEKDVPERETTDDDDEAYDFSENMDDCLPAHEPRDSSSSDDEIREVTQPDVSPKNEGGRYTRVRSSRKARNSLDLEAQPLPDIKEEDEGSSGLRRLSFSDEQPRNGGSPSRGRREPGPTRAMVLEEGQVPPSKLMMKLLGHAKMASHINERILSGLQVQKEDWEELKESAGELNHLLENVSYM